MKKEYYEKYVKYKLKYHQLKKNIIVGGGKKIYTDKFSEKFNEILNFIKTSPKEKIKMEIDPHQSLEIKKQFMNSDLIYEITGWRSKYKLEEDIYEITKWYLQNI